ncbi:hypothetical protein T492DRAFT_910293 [Pavlovales sp. CCMP2436]|nr:hypothetical protein T492DRAFT_910293 [Pavlovales sp. CCMP2436]
MLLGEDRRGRGNGKAAECLRFGVLIATAYLVYSSNRAVQTVLSAQDAQLQSQALPLAQSSRHGSELTQGLTQAGLQLSRLEKVLGDKPISAQLEQVCKYQMSWRGHGRVRQLNDVIFVSDGPSAEWMQLEVSAGTAGSLVGVASV